MEELVWCWFQTKKRAEKAAPRGWREKDCWDAMALAC